MKQTLQTYLTVLTLLFIGCSGHDKQRIRLSGFNDKNEVIYETQVANFIFSKSSLIDYCNKKDTAEHNNFIYRQVVDYLNKYQSNSIIIPDTLGTELVPDSTINFRSKDSTIIRIRNQKSEYAYVTDALDWTLLDLIQNGEIKVYDKKESKFVEYIFLDEINTSSYGAAHILLPNGSLIFSKMRWIE
ncbi:hypothetical protein [Paraflavitalea sp. CAU 1676]|uniref:hypothetical protein n=1 Tax=Paraflavitalea sp. CAU 1676 TaxID=3032598 RepID=UPI0023DCD4DB|nr:hypothetical protein [Paraflavitalea sp. CAU 1676]MDF2188036.1 hypothetical protein [Paraflavitalea sp. CAU 1676]